MDNHTHQTWVINLTGIDKGIFRTMNGNADELIAIGRVIKAGFPCSRVDVTNAKYDAIVDLGGKQKLLRIQIKGTGGDTLNFTGGYRSGVQIDRNAPKRTYKYTKKDCDLILGIDTRTSECLSSLLKTYKNGVTQRVCRNSNTIKRIGKF